MAPSTSTATAEQIAVPETLLKKRRQNDKTREEKLQKATEARKVSWKVETKGSRRWEG
jgi:large subunit ribosomal protein L7e